MNKRIVIVEDDAMAAKVLHYALQDEGYSVQVTTHGSNALKEIVGREVDLVVVDVTLPDMDGFTLCRELRARRYTGPILFASGNRTLAAKVQAFESGADDYVTKPVELLEFLARVNSLIRRFQHTAARSDAVVRVADAELLLAVLTYASDDVAPTLLTPTEMRLLEYLMRRPGQIVSRDALISHVWGFQSLEDTNRIDVYVRRLRHKIERDPVQPRYLRTVRGAGYVFDPPDHAVHAFTISEPTSEKPHDGD
jgi:DNA-binding response OmpR family regulator